MGVSFEAQAQSDNAPRLPRASRPNYNKIHAQSLPVKTYPLPTLIPHNPLSLLQIAFTYISQWLLPPSSQPRDPLCGYFSAETRSVHVTDEATARSLWEQGFFGKGSLSRSEPSWLERERIKQGLVFGDASEDFTRRRREERKQFKQERARKEREAIEEKLAEEAKEDSDSGTDGNAPWILEALLDPSLMPSMPSAGTGVEMPTPSIHRTSSESTPLVEANERGISPSPDIVVTTAETSSEPSERQPKIIINQEHLQLTLEEAFFLVYGLGVLEIQDASDNQKISTSRLFPICRSHSYFPPRTSDRLSPDDPFVLSYVVYHHFRSLGWVVRPGIKFAVDYLLYNRGPVFSHAEFAVIVLPAYSHPYWGSTTALRAEVQRREKKTWWWVHCVNRVQAQVRKTLVVAFVEVPPPVDADSGVLNKIGEVTDIGRFLRRYRVRELILKRWTPNRSRG